MLLPHGRQQVLLLAGEERVTWLTIAFDVPVKRFSLTRIGTRDGASIPTWATWNSLPVAEFELDFPES